MAQQITVVTMTDIQVRKLIEKAVSTGIKAHEAEKAAQAEEIALPDLITRNQAAELLSVSVGTVDNYIKDGLLDKQKIGTHAVRLQREQVEKLARRVDW